MKSIFVSFTAFALATSLTMGLSSRAEANPLVCGDTDIRCLCPKLGGKAEGFASHGLFCTIEKQAAHSVRTLSYRMQEAKDCDMFQKKMADNLGKLVASKQSLAGACQVARAATPEVAVKGLDLTVYHRLTTQWRGPEQCFDVINDGGKNNLLQLADCGNFSGQQWKLTSAAGGHYRLTTQWQGPMKCLDVINDGGKNNLVQLADCGNFSGQNWKLTPAADGHYRLTTEWRGDKMCLDVINDGKKNNLLQLADCGNFSGQLWRVTATSTKVD
jgi:hypothetical protein